MYASYQNIRIRFKLIIVFFVVVVVVVAAGIKPIRQEALQLGPVDFAFVAGSNTAKIFTLEKELNRLRLFKLHKKYFEENCLRELTNIATKDENDPYNS